MTTRLSGLGWSSVFALGVSMQRRLGERFHFRFGDTYNQNPIQGEDSFFNIAPPLFYEYTLSVGGSFSLCRNVAVKFAYLHYSGHARASR